MSLITLYTRKQNVVVQHLRNVNVFLALCVCLNRLVKASSDFDVQNHVTMEYIDRSTF